MDITETTLERFQLVEISNTIVDMDLEIALSALPKRDGCVSLQDAVNLMVKREVKPNTIVGALRDAQVRGEPALHAMIEAGLNAGTIMDAFGDAGMMLPLPTVSLKQIADMTHSFNNDTNNALCGLIDDVKSVTRLNTSMLLLGMSKAGAGIEEVTSIFAQAEVPLDQGRITLHQAEALVRSASDPLVKEVLQKAVDRGCSYNGIPQMLVDATKRSTQRNETFEIEGKKVTVTGLPKRIGPAEHVLSSHQPRALTGVAVVPTGPRGRE